MHEELVQSSLIDQNSFLIGIRHRSLHRTESAMGWKPGLKGLNNSPRVILLLNVGCDPEDQ